MGKRKHIRLYGIDSEPGVFDCEVEDTEGGFLLKSMKKIGEWRKEVEA